MGLARAAATGQRPGRRLAEAECARRAGYRAGTSLGGSRSGAAKGGIGDIELRLVEIVADFGSELTLKAFQDGESLQLGEIPIDAAGAAVVDSASHVAEGKLRGGVEGEWIQAVIEAIWKAATDER